MKPRWPLRTLALLIVPIALANSAALSGCDRKPAVQPGPTTLPPDQTCTTRGVITMLPTPDRKRMLSIHHESIPDFKNKFGDIQPMKTHEMPFPDLAPGLSLDSFAVGDKVELTFEVRWKSDQTWLLTKLSKLNPDTDLQLSR
jgi:hypothetical protein